MHHSFCYVCMRTRIQQIEFAKADFTWDGITPRDCKAAPRLLRALVSFVIISWSPSTSNQVRNFDKESQKFAHEKVDNRNSPIISKVVLSGRFYIRLRSATRLQESALGRFAPSSSEFSDHFPMPFESELEIGTAYIRPPGTLIGMRL